MLNLHKYKTTILFTSSLLTIFVAYVFIKQESLLIYRCPAFNNIIDIVNKLDNKTYQPVSMFKIDINKKVYACGYVLRHDKQYHVIYSLEQFIIVGDFIDTHTKVIQGYEQIQNILKQEAKDK